MKKEGGEHQCEVEHAEGSCSAAGVEPTAMTYGRLMYGLEACVESPTRKLSRSLFAPESRPARESPAVASKCFSFGALGKKGTGHEGSVLRHRSPKRHDGL